MEVVFPRCAGLDVHKDTVVACVRLASRSDAKQEVRSFGTTTKDLLSLGEWLEENKCTHAVMESTGVYWKPVWHVLEGSVELVLANAKAVRNVPGRKSDVSDAMWLANLLAHGLVSSSFVPPQPIEDLRDLTRTRKQLGHELVRHTQRVQKVLESCNIKLASVLSNVLGMSGRKMLDAIVEGEEDPEKLADLANYRVKAKRQELVEALRGRVRPNHRFLLRQHLEIIDALEKNIAAFERQIEEALVPFADTVAQLSTIPGVGPTVAQVLVAEIGTDMSRFPSSAHLVSWAGLCPRMDESAGKRRSTRVRKGNRWLKTMLVQAAWCAVRAKSNYFRSQFYRIRARRGGMKAIVAVAASILGAAYHMLLNGQNYRDVTPIQLDRRDRERQALRLTQRLRKLGYDVELRPAA